MRRNGFTFVPADGAAAVQLIVVLLTVLVKSVQLLQPSTLSFQFAVLLGVLTLLAPSWLRPSLALDPESLDTEKVRLHLAQADQKNIGDFSARWRLRSSHASPGTSHRK